MSRPWDQRGCGLRQCRTSSSGAGGPCPAGAPKNAACYIRGSRKVPPALRHSFFNRRPLTAQPDGGAVGAPPPAPALEAPLDAPAPRLRPRARDAPKLGPRPVPPPPNSTRAHACRGTRSSWKESNCKEKWQEKLRGSAVEAGLDGAFFDF